MSFNYITEKDQITPVSFHDFLVKVEGDFVPPLLSRINETHYYNKIIDYATTILCIDGNQVIVGMVAMYANDITNKIAYITLIAVTQECRGQHVASTLLQMAEKLASTKGMTKILIDTNNVIARKCYEKNGYSVIKTEELENGLTRFFMSKEL